MPVVKVEWSSRSPRIFEILPCQQASDARQDFTARPFTCVLFLFYNMTDDSNESPSGIRLTERYKYEPILKNLLDPSITSLNYKSNPKAFPA